jgi:hypothetical protein
VASHFEIHVLVTLDASGLHHIGEIPAATIGGEAIWGMNLSNIV